MGIETVLHRFPNRADALLRQAAADPLFSSLLDDYEVCLEAMNRFENSSIEHAQRAVEYRQLAVDLEAEILEALKPRR